MLESLWVTLKKELVQPAKLKTRAQARSSIFEWIEIWYQHERSHNSLGYLSPEQFEVARRVGSYDCVPNESGEVHLDGRRRVLHGDLGNKPGRVYARNFL